MIETQKESRTEESFKVLQLHMCCVFRVQGVTKVISLQFCMH